MTAELEAAAGRSVSRETFAKLEAFATLLRAEAANQNLVSSSTLDGLWHRHILDSAQLSRFEPREEACWIDIGSGAGLPGVVIALLISGPVTLVEPRRLRVEFLHRAIAHLRLENRVSIVPGKADKARGKFDVITARAVASVERLLEISTHLSTRKSLWVLPKGRAAQSELAHARRNWQCEGEIVPSCTDPDSGILLLRNVKARGGR